MPQSTISLLTLSTRSRVMVGGRPTPECRLAPLGARARTSDRSGERSNAKPERTDDPVHGPPLTPQDAVASVARRVRRLEAQGLDREAAIRLTAVETGVDPDKVRWCVEHLFGASPVHVSPPLRRCRAALAIAAAF